MKQTKKYNKTKKDQKEVTKNSSNNELKQLGILVAVIVIFLGIVYIVSVLVKGKDYSSIFDNSLDTSEIQYDEILVGTILKQAPDNYYVLVLDEDDSYKTIFESYIATYNGLEYKTKIYTVDLGNGFNKTAKVEEANYGDLKFSGTVLLKIENHEIIESITNSDEIGATIIRMTKELEDSES